MSVKLTAFFSLAALLCTACATFRDPAPAEATGSLGRVVVAPFNVSVRAPEELDGKAAPVWDELLGYLEARDQRVSLLSPISAERLWLEVTSDLDMTDRGRALEIARSRFARALAERRSFDALVLPSLVRRVAHVHGAYASWDGVMRAVPNGSRMLDAAFADVSGPAGAMVRLGGKIAAASLHVGVYGPDGTLLHEGLGGLDLVQEAQPEGGWDDRWIFAVRSRPFDDPRHVSEGIADALERPIRQIARRW